MDRAAAFIDGAYFETALMTYGRLRIDYVAFSDALCSGCERFRTYYYHCMPYQSPSPTEEERKKFAGMRRFTSALRRLPRFEVRLGKVVKFGDEPPHQKQVDTLLAIDLVKLSTRGQIHKAILVAGDADYVPAVEVAKEEGVIVEVYYLPRNLDGRPTLSRDLYDICDDRIAMTKEMLLAFKR